jgi:hypothetical protein
VAGQYLADLAWAVQAVREAPVPAAEARYS